MNTLRLHQWEYSIYQFLVICIHALLVLSLPLLSLGLVRSFLLKEQSRTSVHSSFEDKTHKVKKSTRIEFSSIWFEAYTHFIWQLFPLVSTSFANLQFSEQRSIKQKVKKQKPTDAAENKDLLRVNYSQQQQICCLGASPCRSS